ncbi:MAG: 3-oxoacyl-ACP synthase III [Nitrospirae bacterium]|nr:MAG: 3-oxoacyl-ACP synthase III [Nitrospirota bacterium]
MRYSNVCIESIGYELPKHIVTSAEIEARLSPLYDRLHLPYGRLELMSGIRERRFWENGTNPSDAATMAGKYALALAGIPGSQIECILNCSVSRDFLEPATAALVHARLGVAPKAAVFDISNACLGMLNGMVTLGNMIELGQVKRGLLVAGENGKPLVETTIRQLLADPEMTRKKFKDTFASLTIGSGAAAIVMTHASVSKDHHRLLGGVAESATEHNDLCRGSADTGLDSDSEPAMSTQSEVLMKSGCALAGRTWADFKQELGWTDAEVTRTFCHQVGVAHRRLLLETLKLDPSIDYPTVEFLGNMGSASLPVTMALSIEAGHVHRADKLALLGIGSGLNCLMLGVEW